MNKGVDLKTNSIWDDVKQTNIGTTSNKQNQQVVSKKMKKSQHEDKRVLSETEKVMILDVVKP